MYPFLARLWRTFGGALQWRTLWFFHAKFIIGVSVVALDSSGKVLLLRHRFWKDNSWGLPSGYAIRSETLEDTVRREVKEETQLDLVVDQMLRIKSGFKLRLEVTFLAHVVGGDLKIDPNEVLEAKFFDLDALPSGLLQSHKEIVAGYRQTRQK